MRIAIHPKPVLYFDGVCNLCNRAIRFVIKHDRSKQFMFAPLQSQAGMAALHEANIKGIPAGTVMLFYRGRYYTRSAAALHTLKLLGGLWKLLFIFMLVPPFIRNYVYDYIAARRYKWFGRTESCMIPSPELTERFIS